MKTRIPAVKETAQDIIAQLKELGSEADRHGAARFGIPLENTLGIRIPVLRNLAKTIGKNQSLAFELWDSGYREARILAVYISEPKKLDEAWMEQWVKDFDSWDVCDQCIMGLFDRHPRAFEKAIEWSERTPEFEKRAGFAMMASLAVHKKKDSDALFLPFFDCIRKQSGDDRNFVKKAVNWALRQMGKRSPFLCDIALPLAGELASSTVVAARWIGSDAARELAKKWN